MKNVLKKSVELMDKNQPFAFVTIVESKGSTPRHQAKMLVESNGNITGTVGGGPVELAVVEQARDVIRTGSSRLFTYTLDQGKEDGLPMYCGGDVTFFIEAVGSAPELVLVGGGHVNLAVSRVCDVLGYPYHVIDEREDLEKNYPAALSFHSGKTIGEGIRKAEIGENSHVVICTTNSDEEALEEVLKHPCTYVGMIGSGKKIKAVFSHLKDKGVAEAQLKKVHTPIGLSIGAETPEEIAVSILAEIISVYRKS